ncbi:S41 family peptidase [Pseudoxanthomonas winnipegensis]|uniref:S41 family peptidase n=1 Tax=Pseudoxanthomonas winnipegensis TaxID=2480810 RepID=UPI00103B3B45|nr:S41 family peptidase [Pseudoxanthomonas winnipegensis]TBV76707.1 hypothetical protein EYC45_00660 [Pseudoxanthomonas winnipegensis]
MFRVRRVLPALLLAAVPLCALAAPDFDRDAWRADYATLKQALERDYANLAWIGSTQSGVDLPALDRQTRRALDSAENDAQAEQAIRDFVAGFHDGHFSFLTTLQTGAAAAEPASVDLSAADAASGCAALGVGAGGHPGFSLPFESLPGFKLLSDGMDQPLRTGLLTTPQGQRVGLLRLPEFAPTAYLGLCRQVWQQLRPEDSADDMRDALMDALADAVATALQGFAAAKADLVLVDVGNDPGGNDSGDVLTRLFTTRPVHSAPLLVSQSPAGTAYLDEQLHRLTGALQEHHPDPASRRLLRQSIAAFQQSRRSAGDAPCDLSWTWSERRDWNAMPCRRLVEAGSSGGPLDYLPADAIADMTIAHRLNWAQDVRAHWGAWTGPVYVLTDAKTYSSAEMFAARMHDNGIARTVGVRTGGDGCGFMGKSKPVVLPHSSLRLRMPDCVRLRADGSDEVAGIAPDLPVLPLSGESDRARAWRLLQTVGADWRTRHGGE